MDALAPDTRISASEMHAAARTLVLSSGNGIGVAPYWALEGTQGDEHMVPAHKDLPLVTEKGKLQNN